jgi:hypothetical protein
LSALLRWGGGQREPSFAIFLVPGAYEIRAVHNCQRGGVYAKMAGGSLMAEGAAILDYDRGENIVFIHFATPTQLKTRQQIAEHFKHVVGFWRRHAGGKRSYFVVDITNITIEMAELEFYSRETDKAHKECALTSLRYGDNVLQRAITRLAGLRIHRASNLYRTREEAVAVVRALARGKLTLDPITTLVK